MTDLELAQSASTSVEAQQILLKRHGSHIKGICWKVLNNDDFEDCAQECWMQLFKVLSQFRNESSLSSFIYKVALNVTLQYRRYLGYRNRNTRQFARFEDIEFEPFFHPTIVEDIIRDERAAKLHKAIELIAPSYREAILLRMDGLEHHEAATLTDKRIGTIKSNAFKGRQKLKELLQGEL